MILGKSFQFMVIDGGQKIKLVTTGSFWVEQEFGQGGHDFENTQLSKTLPPRHIVIGVDP